MKSTRNKVHNETLGQQRYSPLTTSKIEFNETCKPDDDQLNSFKTKDENKLSNTNIGFSEAIKSIE